MENGHHAPNGDHKDLGRWHPLPVPAQSTRLRVNNSLIQEKVDFIPASDGKQVTFYCCGPTTYAPSHVGHARCYLTFDIIRRIMEDYFGYEIYFVMNVTDVDDKIIKTARRNFLIDAYRKSAVDVNEVLADVEVAVAEELKKEEEKLSELKLEVETTTKSQQKKDLLEKLKEEELKLEQLVSMQQSVSEAGRKAASLERESAIDVVMAAGRDALAARLDAEKGATVTDNLIFRAHSARYEKMHFEEMENLGIKPPDVLTRVSEYMDCIVSYVEEIVTKNIGYVSNGSVYFDTTAFRGSGHMYGKLCPWKVGNAELAAESEADFKTKEKRNPSDFALWKASKPGEPSWESPWGKGRPGWHIECSAMASELIGPKIDIHGGGMDLKFPHHDNELAQAEAFHGCKQWVNYFLHAGHLEIKGRKMSKSLKNFITIREALEKYTARQIRLLFLIQSWDKTMNWGDNEMDEALGKEKQLKNFFQNIQVALRNADANEQKWGVHEKELQEHLIEGQNEVRERLADNFDTAGALRSIFCIIRDFNTYSNKVAEAGGLQKGLLLRKVVAYVTRILTVFGLINGRWEDGDAAAGGESKETLLAPYLDAFASFRDKVRTAAREGASKDVFLNLSDDLRDNTMVDLGIRLEDKDRGQPSTWKLDDADTLRRERDEKRVMEAQKAREKLENKRRIKLKEKEKWTSAAIAPELLFKSDAQRAKFGQWDEKGIPTHDATGKPLSSKSRKAVEKDMKKAEDAHAQFLAQEAKCPGFFDTLTAELAALDAEIAKVSL